MEQGFGDGLAALYCVADLDAASRVGTMLHTILRAIDDGEVISAARRQWLEDRGMRALADLGARAIDRDTFCARAPEEQAVRIQQNGTAVERASIAAERAADAHAAEKARLKAASEAYFNDPIRRRKLESERLRRRFDTGYIEKEHYPRVMWQLAQLDAGQRLSAVDAAWFQTEAKAYWSDEVRRVWNRIEAEAYADEWQRTSDPHRAAKASACWRKAEQANDALTITEKALNKCRDGAKAESALLTTRGGAMRDLRRFADALALGQDAHALTPKNYHPCTLLGAVNIQLGHHAEGLRWYTMAEKLGAKANVVDQDLRSVWRLLTADEQEQLRAFLLARNPDRYAWVKQRKGPPPRRSKMIGIG